MMHVKAVMLDVSPEELARRRLTGVVAVDREGWVGSETLRVRLRQSPGSPVLAIEDVDVPTLRAEI